MPKYQIVQTIWREFHIEAKNEAEAELLFELANDTGNYLIGEKSADLPLEIEEIK